MAWYPGVNSTNSGNNTGWVWPPPTGTATLTGQAPAISIGYAVQPSTGAVNCTGQIPKRITVFVSEGLSAGVATISGVSGAKAGSVGSSVGLAEALGQASLSLSDFYVWLKDDNQNRVILIEAVSYYSGSEHTNYMGNDSYISRPIDSPANTLYEDIVRGVPSFTTRMSEQFSGQSSPSWGDVDITNENGVRDSWLTWAWDGRAIRVYLGDATWSRDEFRLILSGTVASIYAKDAKTISLKIRDKQWNLNVPVQTTLIGGTTANAGNPKPLCYGECFNIEPVLITAATHEYQIHDGQIEDVVQVYDNGVAVAGFTEDLTNGKFTLNSAPVGRITADVKGAKPSGTYKVKCADIMEHIILNHSTLVSGDLDSGSFTAFNTTCAQTLGLYVRERTNMIEVLDALILSVGGWYGFSRAGKLTLGQFIAPAGDPIISLDSDDVVEGAFKVSKINIPVSTVRLIYKKNWTKMTDGIASAATEARRAELAAEGLISTATDGSIKTAHPLALEPDAESTLIVGQSAADTESARRLALFGVTRGVYSLEGFSVPFSATLGDVIELDHSRFGFSGGALAIVVGITETPTKNRIALDIWK